MLDLAIDLSLGAFVAAFFVFKAMLLAGVLHGRRDPAVVRVRSTDARRARR